MPKAIFWNYKFGRLAGCPEWDKPAGWIVKALRSLGWTVNRHPDLKCGFSAEPDASFANTDLVIYTHTTAQHVRGFTGRQWFMKSTMPDQFHTTLDPLGYGPYSSIAYTKPHFEWTPTWLADAFFEKKVPGWINRRTSKWGDDVFEESHIDEDDYILVVGQSFKDETVESMYWGSYWASLKGVVNALVQVNPGPIVVKLHPWTDGMGLFSRDGKPLPGPNTGDSTLIKEALEALGPQVKVYTGMTSIHDFLAKARCVVLCNSGAGLEALLHKKPVISWGFPEYHWVTYDLRHLCDLPRALGLNWFDESAVAKFIYCYVEQYCISSYDSALQRVSSLLES